MQSKVLVSDDMGERSLRERNDERARKYNGSSREEDRAKQLFVFALFTIDGDKSGNSLLQPQCAE